MSLLENKVSQFIEFSLLFLLAFHFWRVDCLYPTCICIERGSFCETILFSKQHYYRSSKSHQGSLSCYTASCPSLTHLPSRIEWHKREVRPAILVRAEADIGDDSAYAGERIDPIFLHIHQGWPNRSPCCFCPMLAKFLKRQSFTFEAFWLSSLGLN